MNLKNTKYTITAALPYANGPLHIGHIAGAYLPADIFVRYLRLRGKDVAFMCGSDEHGAAITIRAKKEGISPREIIDKYHELNKSTFEKFGIGFDMYHRTSAPIHHELSQEFFTNLYDKGEFVEQESEQYYDEEYNQFLADRYITGTCPKCGHDGAYGDQCEKCGSSLNSTDLINPVSTLSGKKPELRSTKHWFLPLDKYQEWLEKWLVEGKKGQWKSNVYGQCSSWLKAGLQPRAMTRDLDWGVDVPLKEAEGKKLYVWLDAPIGYISATKQWALDNGKNWEDYWKKQDDPKNDSTLIHFIGKDNIVFHCIIFPAILHAHGEYILPENVPANEFLNLEGDKLSTSRNWAVWLHEYLEEFPGKEDVLRYALASTLPETKDSEFTWKDFQTRNNSELVGIFGNFINRALVLTHKYYDGKVPQRGEWFDYDEEIIQSLSTYPDLIEEKITQYKFREALAHMMEFARLGNKYLADTEPWKLQKENPERVKTIMNLSLQIAANLSIVCEPFLPFTAEKLRGMLNIKAYEWEKAGSVDLLEADHTINKAELLFEKIEDETVDAQVKKLEDTKKANTAEKPKVEAMKAEIQFDDFMKMDMRIGTVIAAEKVKKSNKLLKLTIDTGLDKRTILSGIAKHFSAEEMVGKQVTVLVNLAPRPMMGEVSEGMVLMAEDAEGNLQLLQPGNKVNPGSTVS
ncbi:methionine--tRNA ligase [Marivirga sp. S37H4]|uniref:Methionine--tRNA ligase n=1 Tax=Marivirga aurantiaca TaxID=2802615 RepID=A0A935C4S9_9BACT|nr:methionine--tRNA ligase [Marivirga aurantiaca]MBK6263440.1 methionine--tRNA ligase [Marivirga aurantiaca]